jgi:hypothetical protein
MDGQGPVYPHNQTIAGAAWGYRLSKIIVERNVCMDDIL